MTMLDPHPARIDGQKHHSGLAVFETALTLFQLSTYDPKIVVPDDVDESEVFYQKNYHYVPGLPFSESVLNLWGEPVQADRQCNLTGHRTETIETIGHAEVHDWYQEKLVSDVPISLASICPRSVPAPPPAPPHSNAAFFLSTFVDVLGIAESISQRLTRIQSHFDHNRINGAIGDLKAFAHFLDAQRSKHVVSEAADLLIATTQVLISNLALPEDLTVSTLGTESLDATECPLEHHLDQIS